VIGRRGRRLAIPERDGSLGLWGEPHPANRLADEVRQAAAGPLGQGVQRLEFLVPEVDLSLHHRAMAGVQLTPFNRGSVNRPHYVFSDFQNLCYPPFMGSDTLLVSDRGQVTLPKRLRDRLALKAGSALVVEERDGALVLRPAAVTPLRMYTDEEIQGWLRDDRVAPGERQRILKKARSRRK